MKQLTLLAALLSVLLSVHATAQNHPVFGNAPQTTRLPNGLTVVSVQWNTPGIVAYYTLVRVGSRDEVEAGHSGFAHLFEHMMFRGTRTMPNREYDQRILSFGADNNAFTTRDYTLYTTTAPSTVLGELMQVESDRFRNLYYDESVFRTETGAVQGEYAKAVSNPGMAMWEALSEISFPRHTYGHTTLGYLRDICRMPTRFDYSRRFFRRFYTPDNSTLIVVGDVDHDELVRLARQHYGRWRGRRARVRIPTQQAPEGGRRHIPWDGAAPPQMYMGYRTPAFDGGHARGARRAAALRETAALEVVKGLVFAESAPLYQKLVVQDRALLRMGASDGMFTRDPGLFIVSATLTPPSRDFDAVVGSIQEAVAAVANGTIDAERFDAVRSHQRYSLLAGLQTPTDVAGLLGKIVAVGGNVGALDEYLEALAAVTPEDVARAARTYLIEDRRYVVTLAPRVDADGPAPEPGNPCERALGLVED